MRVILLRHGIAHDRADPACPADPGRALTEEGRKKTRKAVRRLVRVGVQVTRIITSPYVRAKETADIAAEILGIAIDDIVVSDALLPQAASANAAAVVMMNVLMRIGNPSVWDVGLF